MQDLASKLSSRSRDYLRSSSSELGLGFPVSSQSRQVFSGFGS